MIKKPLLIISCIVFLVELLQAQVKIHSHNDYAHKKPFYEAISAKVYSIEADVFLIGDSLFVAHNKTEIKAGNTLNSLYLEPIKWFSQTDNFYNFQLMIDIKDNWDLTYPLLEKLLNQYKRTFSRQGKSINIAISGNRPPDSTYHNYPKFITFDGLPGHNYQPKDLKKVAMISDNFKTYSKWKGVGLLPETDKQKLIAVINEAHSKGKLFRFWNAPDNPLAWEILKQLGADIINTDAVEEATIYFKKK